MLYDQTCPLLHTRSPNILFSPACQLSTKHAQMIAESTIETFYGMKNHHLFFDNIYTGSSFSTSFEFGRYRTTYTYMSEKRRPPHFFSVKYGIYIRTFFAFPIIDFKVKKGDCTQRIAAF